MVKAYSKVSQGVKLLPTKVFLKPKTSQEAVSIFNVLNLHNYLDYLFNSNIQIIKVIKYTSNFQKAKGVTLMELF